METNIRQSAVVRLITLGMFGAALLLGIYFAILTLISGWNFALSQFSEFWYFIVSLAIGFGIQLGLYSYLRTAIRGRDGSGKVVAVSGTTSTAAMISCCSHYLVNILPVLGTAGIITMIAQYQVGLFWVGLAANAAGIAYVGNQVLKFSAEHIRKGPPAAMET